MKKSLMIFGVILILTQAASAKLLLDSMYNNPTYIEAGDNVDIYMKFHEDPSTWKLTSVKTSDGERQPVGKDQDIYYITKIVCTDESAKANIILKNSERDVGYLDYGESWTSPFEVKVSEKAPEGQYGMQFVVLKTNMEKTSTPEIVLTHRFNLTVEGDPKFSITSDNLLTAGEIKRFKVSLSNVGGGIAKHATISLNASSPLTVLKSSSSYMGDMSGKIYRDVYYELHVDSAASPKAYSIPVTITYNDRSGVSQEMDKTLGVKVAGLPSVTSNIDSFTDLKQDMEGTVTVNVVNKGFIDAKFLSIEVLDTDKYTVTSNSEVYIGNLASDDFEKEDFTVKVKKGVAGKIPMKVRVTYTEDNNNEVHVLSEEMELNVMTDAEYLKKNPAQNGTEYAQTIVFGLVGLIVGYLALWFILKILGAITGFIDRHLFKRI
ncbi:COG1361 S-layer family protein [Candidatus Altiarchaeota archaeon]